MHKRYYGVVKKQSLRMSILDIVRQTCAEQNRVRRVQRTLQWHTIDAVDKMGRVACNAVVRRKIAELSNQFITEHIVGIQGYRAAFRRGGNLGAALR